MDKSVNVVRKAKEPTYELSKLGSQVAVASENGLFSKVDEQSKQALDTLIESAMAKLCNPNRTDADICAAEIDIYKATRLFDEIWITQGVFWRLCEWGLVHHLASLTSIMAAILIFISLGTHLNDYIPLSALIYGTTGATLRSLYWHTWQANRRCLRRVWVASAYVAPFIGMLLAAGVFIAFQGGLLLLTKSDTQPNPHAINFFCFFAGFKWDWALERLEKIAKGAFSEAKAKELPTKNSST